MGVEMCNKESTIIYTFAENNLYDYFHTFMYERRLRINQSLNKFSLFIIEKFKILNIFRKIIWLITSKKILQQ